MPKLIDLTGKQIGELTVLRRVDNDKYGKPRWLVKCSCGNEVIKTGNHLPDSRFCRRGGHSRIGVGKAAFNAFYSTTKRSAIKRGYEWHLSKEEVMTLSQQDCFYCGKHPSQIMGAKSHRVIGDFIYNGIDRTNNSIGYTLDNCVPCCGKCNTMKMDMDLEEFKNQVINILHHWIKPSSD